MLTLCIFGFLFGFVGSMPMAGPVGALILGNSLDGRIRIAFHIGLGAAVAEGAYAALAFLGFSTLLAEYPMIVPASRAVAAAMLLALGLYFLLRKRAPKGHQGKDASRPGRSLLAGFTVTALNPTLLAIWGAAAASTLSIVEAKPGGVLCVPFGVAATAGIVCWYALFTAVVRRQLHRFKQRTLHGIIRGVGVLLVGLGVSFVWWSAAGA